MVVRIALAIGLALAAFAAGRWLAPGTAPVPSDPARDAQPQPSERWVAGSHRHVGEASLNQWPPLVPLTTGQTPGELGANPALQFGATLVEPGRLKVSVSEDATDGRISGESLPPVRLRATLEEHGQMRVSWMLDGWEGSIDSVEESIQIIEQNAQAPYVCVIYAHRSARAEHFLHLVHVIARLTVPPDQVWIAGWRVAGDEIGYMTYRLMEAGEIRRLPLRILEDGTPVVQWAYCIARRERSRGYIHLGLHWNWTSMRTEYTVDWPMNTRDFADPVHLEEMNAAWQSTERILGELDVVATFIGWPSDVPGLRAAHVVTLLDILQEKGIGMVAFEGNHPVALQRIE